jgi:hypothetical protein
MATSKSRIHSGPSHALLRQAEYEGVSLETAPHRGCDTLLQQHLDLEIEQGQILCSFSQDQVEGEPRFWMMSAS